ncbi:prealbumin-like fold domain-containing protein, partial [Leifsonia sp. 2TAF2]|uniref:prealbumin-like fold domain-containing protein n=1 Tax=Leifsonia sp. 2TAF2 TaxID=3233009 RepID=UPI003F988CC5
MVSYRILRARRWRLVAALAGFVALGALVGTLILPQYFSNASTTAVSTTYQTATNTVTGSVAASADAPGGAKTGTAKPGDKLKWVTNYQNNTGADASVNVKDVLTTAGTYVAGSLQLPPNQNAAGTFSPQYSTNGGTSWATGTPPSNANGVGFTGTVVPQGTQQLSVKVPSPVSQTLSNTGGDAYNAVVSADGLRVYAVFHHQNNNSATPPVYCGVIATGAVCPGWPASNTFVSAVAGTALGQGTGTMATAWENGTWLSGTKLFWFQGSQSAPLTTGLGCLDVSTLTSCGYTVLGAGANGLNSGAQIGGTAIAASNGSFYALTVDNGAAALKCINSAGGACGSLTLATGTTGTPTLAAATFGTYVFASFQQTPTSKWQMYCYQAGGSLCAGAWPVTTSVTAAPYGPIGMAPLLSTTGAVTGVCTIPNGNEYTSACYNTAGAVVNTAYPSNIWFSGGGYGAGDAYQAGSKVYISGGNTVQCLDFSKYTGTGTAPTCAGFTPPVNGTNYTVRSASAVAPNCLVAAGDGRTITFFNAITGGGCLGVSGPTSMTVAPLTSYCGSGAAGFTGWGTLSIPGLVAGTYTNSTVTLRDQNNNVITGFNGLTLPAGGTFSLGSIPKTVTSITATVVVNGVNDPTGVVNGQIKITWSGLPPEMCFETTASPVACDAAVPLTLSNTANAVTTSAAGTDAPGGNTTGVTRFTVSPDLSPASSQCTIGARKAASVQSARPGDKVTYTIYINGVGSQAYNNATFSDDLSDVLKDATYNGDATADIGTVSYSAPTLSWSGALPGSPGPGNLATITYSVTVKSPDTGDHAMVNTLVTNNPGNGTCQPGSVHPNCTANVQIVVSDVLWHKVDATAARNVLTGAEWSFTPVDGAGKPTGASVAVTDCVAVSAASCTGADIDPLGGLFRLTNLGPGTYQLVETRAPVGFRLNPTPIAITVATATVT